MLLAFGISGAGSASVTSTFPGEHTGAAIVSLDKTRNGQIVGAVGSLALENNFGVVKFNRKGHLDKRFGRDGVVKPFGDEDPDL